MKFDMHCHTKEGSIDAKVDIVSYAKELIKKGYDGMLVTDHNSYKGYEKWLSSGAKMEYFKNFTVLKGIEYDTKDGGHTLVILPDHVNCSLLEKRGLSLSALITLVHKLDGIIGPAHPYGTGYFAFMNTKLSKKCSHFLSEFDFIETCNSGIHPLANKRATLLAQIHDKPQTAGSDAHHMYSVGTAATNVRQAIHSNNDLIRMIRLAHTSGQEMFKPLIYKNAYKKPNELIKQLGIVGYYLYNKLCAFLYLPARIVHITKYQ